MGMQAYKESEVGRIPIDWSVKQIGRIGYTYSGLTGKEKNDFGKGKSRYITFLNVLNNPVLRTDIFEKVSVSEGEHQNLALKGDLFFNTSSETPEEVGICALLNEDVPSLYLNSFCFGYRLTDPEVDGLFLSYYFRSKAGRDIMTMLAQGATRYNLSKESFNKTLIAFPPFDEQKKIAKAISGVDDMIGALDEAIAKKQQIKEGLMQQLLTGKTRLPGFSEEWKEYSLGEFCQIIMGQSPSSSYYNSKGEGLPLIQGNADLNNRRSFIRMYTSMITKVCEEGDIIMSVRAPVGAVGKASYKSCLGRGVCAMKASSDFLYHYLVYNENNWGQFSKGSTFDSINCDDLKSVALVAPQSIEEQNEIASILSKCEAEVGALENQRAKYILIKQGMMQQLLTGKTRL